MTRPRPKVPVVNAFEELFAFQCRAYKLPVPEREYRFALGIGRQWRFDFAWPELFVAVEIEGLVVRRQSGKLTVSGRHASISGMREDMVKYNQAAIAGWCVLRFEQSMVKAGLAIIDLKTALEAASIRLTRQHLREAIC